MYGYVELPGNRPYGNPQRSVFWSTDPQYFDFLAQFRECHILLFDNRLKLLQSEAAVGDLGQRSV